MRLSFLYFCGLCFLCIGCQEDPENQSYLLTMRTDTEIDFNNRLVYTDSINPYTYRNFYNGSGVAIGDLNNDGLEDIFFTGNQVDNQLYQNLGDFTFKDVTEGSHTASSDSWCTGVSMVDINADGLLDIYVCKAGPPSDQNRRNQLFINQGDFVFEDQAVAYGLDILGLSIHAVFFDFDRDGDLDCYLLNNSLKSVGGYDLIKGQRDIASSDGNKFMVNEGGRFIDRSTELGIYSSGIGFGLGIAASDFNQDGYIDLYVANDFFEKDYFYLNQAGQGFKEVGEQYFSSFPLGSMGADAADFNNDLRPDIFVAEMLPQSIERKKTKAVYDSWEKYLNSTKQGYYHQFSRNMLFSNQGNRFTDLSRMNHMDATDWSWAPLFIDIDQDGHKDLFISNGIGKDLLDRDYLNYMSDEGKLQQLIKNKNDALADLIDLMPSERIQNAIFHNDGHGAFTDQSTQWSDMPVSFSNASAYGDLDNDGDLDMVISNVDDPAFILENTSNGQKHGWIGFTLKSNDQNTSAIGAQIIAYEGERTMMIEQIPYKGFQSSVSHKLSMGIGPIVGEHLDSLIIRWPDGTMQRMTEVNTNKYITIEKAASDKVYVLKQSNDTSLIQVERMESIAYQSTVNHPSDFNRDPLIPYMATLPEPVMVLNKSNTKAINSLLIGGTKGNQTISLDLSNHKSKSVSSEKKLSYSYVSDIELLDVENDGDMDIYLAHGTRMFTPYSTELHDKILLNDGQDNYTIAEEAITFQKPIISSSVSSGDINGDGYTDVVITEPMTHNTYGLPGSLYVYLNDQQGGFSQIEKEELKDIGTLTSSAIADINGDGRADIIIAGEWMGIKIMTYQDKRLRDITEDYQLAHTRGLWQALYIADVDSDGDQDIIAANMGTNGYFDEHHALLVKDIDGNGKVDQLLLKKRDGDYYPIQDFEELFMRVPIIKKTFDQYKDYAAAALHDMIEVDTAEIQTLDLLESCIFFNEKDHFRREPLPTEAQYSSVHAIAVHDANGDGVNDILIGGNHYKFKPQYGRQDASTGLLIQGIKTDDGYQYGKTHHLNIEGEINSILPIDQNEYYIGIRNKNIYKYQINIEQ